MSDDFKQHFTMVFEGDIGKFEKNPLLTDTPFGRPVTIGRGDAFAERDDYEDDALRLHREKMDYFEKNIALRKALEAARPIVSATCDAIIEASTAEPYLAALSQIDAALTPAVPDADGEPGK